MILDRKSQPQRGTLFRNLLTVAVLGLLMVPPDCATAMHHSEKEQIRYLKSLSLEDLVNLEVTSVSKKSEKLSDAAAAAFVITDEDIRRSGVTSIPDALRMVPGIQVAHIDANKWAVTARGFNGSFANKLLVMIDGRSVYSPLWSGVFWNVQDTMLEDIDRIEVIRGPGASLWGANAVNGIINIITKKAQDTQGGLVSGGVGTEERGFAAVRYGWQPSDESHARIYAKYFNRDDSEGPNGEDGHDQWSGLRSGFRFDWAPHAANAFTLQGDIYSKKADATYELASLTPPDYMDTVLDESELDGGNLLTRWEHTTANDANLVLQIYYDHTQTKDELVDEVRDTFDIDFQHRLQLNESNEVIWGLGYRTTRDETEDLRNTAFDPNDRTLELYSFFVQDRITIVPDRFWLTLGSKFENHTYTDWEVQPTARFLWKPKENQSVWGAVSRATRTPTRAERDLRFDLATIPPAGPPPLPVQVQVYGSDDFESEEVLAFELGYRLSAYDWMILDVAGFYNEYDDLYSSTSGTPLVVPGPPPYIIAPETIDNSQKVDSRGVEVALNLIPTDWWKIDVAYTYLTLSQKTAGKQISGSSPRNQLSIRSSLDLPKNVELDVWVRYVDDLPVLNVDDYVTVDVRLSWKPRQDLELSIVGKNLTEEQHLEFVDQFFPVRSTEVERSVFTKVTWEF